MLKIILLGLGVQSTALYLMSSMGVLPKADMAIFVDIGKEGAGTYAYLQFLQSWQTSHDGLPLVVLTSKNLFRDLLHPSYSERPISIPAFTYNPDGTIGMLRRQCTSEYKIKVMDDYIRDTIYGLPKYARRPETELWYGITTDEIERLSIPREAWKVNSYPFAGYYTTHGGATEALLWARPMSRQDVIRWYVLHMLPVPPKSACVFCPYQSDASWARRKKLFPEDFAAAVAVDKAIRNSTRAGVLYPVFLHRSCKPLDSVEFDSRGDKDWGECSGTCHV